MGPRVGFGYDVHRLEEGESFILGGVAIEHEKGPTGHSDADALLHAICDAMLGAANLGDIGQLFPDNSEEWQGADSQKLLQIVHQKVRDAGYQLGNIDATVCLQQPKLTPYIPEMKKVIADALGVSPSVISVKATTSEKLGFIGREEGISANAVVLLQTTS
jgi:2-C-methyl-D-erythritol 2,4-cyclodiphosphate synthase